MHDILWWVRNLALMCCPNILQWYWLPCVCIRRMTTSGLYCPRANRWCVRIGLRLGRLKEKVLSMFDGIWSRDFTLIYVYAVQIHYDNNNDDFRAFMFVEYMESCCVCPGRTVCAFVVIIYKCLHLKLLFAFHAIWGCTLTPIWCPNTLQFRSRLYVYVRLMYGTRWC